MVAHSDSDGSPQSPPTTLRVVVLCRSYLPYHLDHLRELAARGPALGLDVTGIEVTATDPDYRFLAGARDAAEGVAPVTCLPGRALEELSVAEVHRAVSEALDRVNPAAVFAPATPFAEGMAAIRWALARRRRAFIMDDAWEATDPRGWLVRRVKRAIHGCVDGIFAPHVDYRSYWQALGVPPERVVGGLDVVDNARFTRPHDCGPRARAFLYVGRALPRKGLPVLLAAYRAYRSGSSTAPFGLDVAGPVPAEPAEGVRYLGTLAGIDLCRAFWNASALVVPSDFDQWGLVVNEAMAAGLPVLATTTVGSARALIEDGVNGWRVAPRDPAALAAKLAHIAALDAGVLAAIGARASTTISEHCPLSAFGDGIARALALPAKPAPSLLSRLAAATWPGRTLLGA
jgi:glycosyltransferase involved in cell wall biosynthesis